MQSLESRLEQLLMPLLTNNETMTAEEEEVFRCGGGKILKSLSTFILILTRLSTYQSKLCPTFAFTLLPNKTMDARHAEDECDVIVLVSVPKEFYKNCKCLIMTVWSGGSNGRRMKMENFIIN